jgi:hypothetical protein
MPAGVSENIAYLKEWQKNFHGDCFAYEYHFMWDHIHDPGYFEMARVLSEDIKNLKKIGLKGIISDQTQRSYFPTGFPMYILGKTMWDDKLDFEKAAEKFFVSVFGKDDGLSCMKYMKQLSSHFDPVFMRGEKRSGGEDTGRDFTYWKITGDASEIDNEIIPRLENP